MRQLRQLLQLNPVQFWLLIQVAVVLNLIRLGLVIVPFQTLYRWMKQTRSSPHPTPSIPSCQITWAVNVVGRYSPGQVQCLARALTTQLLMQQGGYPCEIRIGVTTPENDKFEAHAWVESQGEIVMGDLPDLQRYTLLM